MGIESPMFLLLILVGTLCGVAGAQAAPYTLSVAAGTNFYLNAGSPCINAGVTLSSPYNFDVAGVDQDSHGVWEIGAYAYTPASPASVIIISKEVSR